MMKNKSINKIIKSKYFYIITLLMVWSVTQVSQTNLNVEPIDSVQLSSNATEASEQYYDLHLRLLETQTVLIDSSPVVLKKGAVLTVTVPFSNMGHTTDVSRINLTNVMGTLPNERLPPYATPRNEAVIYETDRFQPQLFGETAKIDLQALAKNKKIRLEKVEETQEEEGDDDSEGSLVDCTSGDCNRNSVVDNFTQFINGVMSPPAKINSVDDIVKSFVSSEMNRKLQNKIKAGYSIKVGSKRYTLKDRVKSSSKKMCLRGVKEALLQGGVVNKYLGTKHAQQFGPTLATEGFLDLMKTDYKNKIKSPYDAPVGSVLIYAGGKSGHAEIRTPNGFISDYFSETARTGSSSSGLAARGRRLIGVYIKKTPEVNLYLAKK